MTEVTTNEVVETAVVADYLELVKAEKMEESAAYLIKFFGEGENLDIQALEVFQKEVEEAVKAELAAAETEDATDAEVSEA